MDKQKIDRINFLARKFKSEGLTPEETAERQQLRDEYIDSFRKSMRAQLDSIVIMDEQGNKKPLKSRDKTN